MEDRETFWFRWDKSLCKECGCDVVSFFLSHRTPKIPASLNKSALGSKIVGKGVEKKRVKVRIMADCWRFFTASATWPIIFMSASFPCEQKHTWACPFAAANVFYRLFYHACDPVSSCWTHCIKICATYQMTCYCWNNSISHIQIFPVNC